MNRMYEDCDVQLYYGDERQVLDFDVTTSIEVVPTLLITASYPLRGDDSYFETLMVLGSENGYY